ncbi:hypothetical protein [Desulfopila sp. IMCC35008]|uniref:hypothetical protein n=1 Tax=Desulfopila sp. IMCC35008 TaxID=2653858 RepID=UPI0013D86BD0|nr:hypothetical protein [Desulfopila sp. IMCC35008]
MPFSPSPCGAKKPGNETEKLETVHRRIDVTIPILVWVICYESRGEQVRGSRQQDDRALTMLLQPTFARVPLLSWLRIQGFVLSVKLVARCEGRAKAAEQRRQQSKINNKY